MRGKYLRFCMSENFLLYLDAWFSVWLDIEFYLGNGFSEFLCYGSVFFQLPVLLKSDATGIHNLLHIMSSLPPFLHKLIGSSLVPGIMKFQTVCFGQVDFHLQGAFLLWQLPFSYGKLSYLNSSIFFLKVLFRCQTCWFNPLFQKYLLIFNFL